MTVEQAIAKLQKYTDQKQIIAIDWFDSLDIQAVAEEFDTVLTDKGLSRVAEQVENGDAEIGMNWESIRYAISCIVEER